MSVAAKSRAEDAPSLAPVFTYPKDEPVFYITKLFNAPRALVWRAMSDPALIPQWWGPRRYKTEVMEMDFRVGGKWRFANVEADGKRHEFFGEYRELKAPERIVQTFGFMQFPPAIETMALEDMGEQTRLTVQSRFPDIAHRDGMVGSGMEGGARETYERLDQVVEWLKGQGPNAQLAGREMTITRLFDAPRELVWKAWTEPKFFAAWWGPYAFSAPIVELDVRVGGKLHVVMSNPAMGDNDVRGEFTEVDAPSRLSFTSAAFFENGQPKITQATTLVFTEENGKTRMTLHTKMLSATPDMAQAVAGWPVGWGQSLDKLEALVATMRMVS